ncbi:MAG: hypothetical protein HS129_05815 [Leptospiraceae bacterium]|nr:hypothetical protein [Leptospiraceae bacterium]
MVTATDVVTAQKASCSACPLKSNCISENQDRRELNIYDGVNVPETERCVKNRFKRGQENLFRADEYNRAGIRKYTV